MGLLYFESVAWSSEYYMHCRWCLAHLDLGFRAMYSRFLAFMAHCPCFLEATLRVQQSLYDTQRCTQKLLEGDVND